ncbi:hypothetical protein [Undibacterium sp. Ren11W]|uniref:hypothetical protein n=1 Tax=Undibacterium sp. Ren11W TaxID=3413045 RepID=UPI003BF3839C
MQTTKKSMEIYCLDKAKHKQGKHQQLYTQTNCKTCAHREQMLTALNAKKVYRNAYTPLGNKGANKHQKIVSSVD